MNRIELMKHRIGLLLKLNVFQFIKYNFFKKNIHRAKGAYIMPFRQGKILLAKDAKIYLNGTLLLNKPVWDSVLSVGKLALDGKSEMFVNGRVTCFAGYNVAVRDGVLKLGGENYLHGGSHIICQNSISLGEGSGVSFYSVIRDFAGHPSGTNPNNVRDFAAPVVIGKHVWIGERAFVSRGTMIGDGAIVGANATVSGTIPPRAMVAPSMDKVVLSDVYWFLRENTKDEELRKYYNNETPLFDSKKTPAPKDILEKVLAVFASLGYDESISEQQDLIGCKIVDSLALLSLVAELEEQFSVKIPISEVNGQNFYSVGTIAAMMDKFTKNHQPSTVNRQPSTVNNSVQARKPLELHIEDTEKTVIQRIFENSVKTPDKVAIITENSETTYLELCKLIYSYSETYRRLGVKAGDNIVLQAIRDVRYIAAFYACHLLSAVPVPVENEIGKERVVEIARETNAQLIICNYMNCGKKCISYEQLDDKTNIVSDVPFFSLKFPDLNEPAQILFTTGTTGKSKGVVHSHRNLSAGSYSFAKGMELRQNDIHGDSFPLNHGGANIDMLTVLSNGQTFVIIPGWNDLNQVMRILFDGKVTSVFCPPVALRMLSEIAKDTEGERIKEQFDYVVVAGAPASKNTVDEFLTEFSNAELLNMYGTTECFLISCDKCNTNSQISLGFPLENADIQLQYTDNANDADKKIGRIVVKCPQNMMGYYNDPEQTNSVFDNGYLILADFGYFDENGALHFAGRADDVINVGGYKISPIETEAVAEESGLVQECILIKSFDKHNNEYLELLAVPKQPEFSSEALMNFIKDKVEAYRVPKKITVVDELKKTYNGKLDRKAYRS